MKKQAFNPYLPLNEYVPDGEPYVFGDRVYVYGSHDEAGSEIYCAGHYVGWSAPVDDLSDWQYHGVIYQRFQDPSNPNDELQLWAPDVVIGPDGRYYLYYCFPFRPEIGVAVSDSPAGPFEFYGHVHNPDGSVLSEKLPFDPAVLVDDDGRVYLYYGFAGMPNPHFPPIELSPGCLVAELEQDMVTVKKAPHMCAPGQINASGTEFEGHAFYEAASIRKIGSVYYLVYSSQNSHELCYATSIYPDREFKFGGTIISNGDVSLNGRTKAVNMTGNNHGGIVEVNGQWYVFHHRQTHATEASRQGCAEKITILPDGSIPQVEMTSCGLNGKPLLGQGTYSTAYACHLTGGDDQGIMIYGQDRKKVQPYIYQEGEDLHYIANVGNNTVFGWKYFALEQLSSLSLTVRGNANGVMELFTQCPEGEAAPICVVPVSLQDSGAWTEVSFVLSQPLQGTLPLYIRYSGEGSLDAKDLHL